MDANKILIFKVCVAALWANEQMARQEKDYVNNLIERLAESEEDKDFLRKVQTHDMNLKVLEPEIRNLSLEHKKQIFEECFGIISSDKILDELDLRFLKNLKNICAIKSSYYRSKIKEARIYKGVKIKRRIKRFVTVAIAIWVALQILLGITGKKDTKDFPKEAISGETIDIQILSDLDLVKRRKLSAQEIYKDVCRSVVTVYVKKNNIKFAQGTGSIIGKDKNDYYYVLTNKHVVLDKKSKAKRELTYEIQLYTNARFDARLDFCSRKLDLAILRVKMPEEYVKIIKISPKKFQNVGDRVYTLGTPIGMSNTFTEGIISALREEKIQTDATAFYGNSGGPLINEYAELIGIVTSGFMFKDYSFAIYADKVIDLLKEREDLRINKQKLAK